MDKKQHDMQEKLDMQCTEIDHVHAGFDNAQDVLHREKQEFDDSPEKTNDGYRAILSSLSACPHAAREEPVQKLRKELEVARGMISEEQEVAEELRQKLKNEESA